VSEAPRIGIVGGGQLARMLGLAAHPLGLAVRALDPDPNCCAAAVLPVERGALDDPLAIAAFARDVDVLTFDFENVAVAPLQPLALGAAVRPAFQVIACAQDRLAEKQLFQRLDIPTPAFTVIDSRADLAAAIAALDGRGVLKTRRFGYDGKGQWRVDRSSDPNALWRDTGGAPMLLEAFVPFDFELSQLIVRGVDGAIGCYPPIANVHRDGVLHLSASIGVPPQLAALAETHARRIVAALDYVGVLAIEFFVRDGALMGNELAPRVHNSGHLTIEGHVTSQFENHLRAIAGLPLGDCAPRGAALMLNFLGQMPARASWLARPGSHWHDYGKAPRVGRKVGHVTITAPDWEGLRARVPDLDALPTLISAMARSGGQI
jgi:5-(carboxyamino)imidazole ribonucleotide synthase